MESETATVRSYESGDAAATLAVFLDAITQTASVDYTPEQVAAWARPQHRTVPSWDEGMRARDSIVAVVGDDVAGFSDVSPTGYVDMMFVSPRFARRGVASALMEHLEQHARDHGITHLHSNVSITARPFFEHHGFTVVAEQHPVTQGVVMTNFRMEKDLADAD